jgi:predicted KAP-like P-loop ATPase
MGVLFLLAMVSAVGSWVVPVAVLRWTAFVAAALLLLWAAIVGWLGSLATDLASIFQATVDASQLATDERKSHLKKLLSSSPRPLLVVLDDVDRLTSEEVRQLLQLVKSNADFPQMIYLLLGQRDTIEKSLEALSPISGRAFLEKIVQVPFDVPKAEKRRVQNVLFVGLNQILASPHLQSRFDERRWTNVFLSGVSDYFVSLRDVRRYLGSLAFHFELFRTGDSSEVNPIDLIALEALRVFEHDIYAHMHDERLTLTEPIGGPLSNRTREDEKRARLAALVDRAPESRRDRIRSILSTLFPPVVPLLSNSTPHMDNELWLRELRVCAPTIFDRYFLFAIPQGELSQADIDSIISHSGDRDALVAIFGSLLSRELLADALDRLEAYKQTLDIANAGPFVTALFDIGDSLPPGTDELFAIEPDMHAARIIHWYLKILPDVAARFSILADAIEETIGIFLPVRVVSVQQDDNSDAPDPDSLIPDLRYLRRLQELCLVKIRAAASDGRLSRHSRMLYILYRWRDWSGAEEPSQWVEALTRTPEGLLAFLSACSQKVRSAGANELTVRVTWRMQLDDIESFIPLTTISERVAQLPPIVRNSPDGQRLIGQYDAAIRSRNDPDRDDPGE